MRKALAAVTMATALSTVPVFGSVSAHAPAQSAADDDNGGDDGNWGLFGLIGLLGLAGLAGLRRKDQDRSTGTTMSGTAPSNR
jgi:MYXO-CTERM domain-containing protein